MKREIKSIFLQASGIAMLCGLLGFAASAQTQNTHPAQPGSINYVEDQASIEGQSLSANSVGNVILQRDQILNTQSGKVEVLLTPGVFLRVDDNSAVKMISPDLAKTEVEVSQGRAMVEVTNISKNNDIRIDENGAQVQLMKQGLYDFDPGHSQVRVFKGEAEVFQNDQKIKVGDQRELTLNTTEKPKPQKFDERQYADDFYRWSGLRSGYLAEADADAAHLYVNGGPGWYGAGWYWDPWFAAYTFIPAEGIFYSPFGWGFYSPFAIYRSPFYYHGWYGRPHAFREFHEPYGHGFVPEGGFHGGVSGFHGAPPPSPSPRR
jgi:hypothetical protein